MTTFNESVTKLLSDEKTRDTANARLNQRPTRKMLKHIIQQVKKAVCVTFKCFVRFIIL